MKERTKIAIVSVGDPFLSDDDIGNTVVGQLKKELKKEWSKHLVIRAENRIENFLVKLKEASPELLLIIDAVAFEGEPGDVRIFGTGQISDVFASTHRPSMDIIRSFLPATEIRVIGIRPAKVEPGEKLSDELKKKLPRIKNEIRRIISSTAGAFSAG